MCIFNMEYSKSTVRIQPPATSSKPANTVSTVTPDSVNAPVFVPTSSSTAINQGLLTHIVNEGESTLGWSKYILATTSTEGKVHFLLMKWHVSDAFKYREYNQSTHFFVSTMYTLIISNWHAYIFQWTKWLCSYKRRCFSIRSYQQLLPFHNDRRGMRERSMTLMDTWLTWFRCQERLPQCNHIHQCRLWDPWAWCNQVQ